MRARWATFADSVGVSVLRASALNTLIVERFSVRFASSHRLKRVAAGGFPTCDRRLGVIGIIPADVAQVDTARRSVFQDGSMIAIVRRPVGHGERDTHDARCHRDRLSSDPCSSATIGKPLATVWGRSRAVCRSTSRQPGGRPARIRYVSHRDESLFRAGRRDRSGTRRPRISVGRPLRGCFASQACSRSSSGQLRRVRSQCRRRSCVGRKSPPRSDFRNQAALRSR